MALVPVWVVLGIVGWCLLVFLWLSWRNQWFSFCERSECAPLPRPRAALQPAAGQAAVVGLPLVPARPPSLLPLPRPRHLPLQSIPDQCVDQ